MLESRKRMIGKVPVLELKGRFDSHGATVFEKEVASPDLAADSFVLDVSQVNYLSSMGVRALLKTQKALKRKGGGIILAGVPPFLEKVMELSGILVHFSRTSGLEEAVQLAAQSAPSTGIQDERILDGRRYLIRQLETGGAALDTWGSPAPAPGKLMTPDTLVSVDLHDLGVGFGIGGFGPDRDGASQALGELVAAGGLAGVAVADPYGESDYLLGGDLLNEEGSPTPPLEEIFQSVRNLDLLAGAAHLGPETEILRPRVWLYRFSEVRPGTEKILKIEASPPLPEAWEQIAKRLFPDAARLVLEPLEGGYMGKTFRVIPYARDGRRMLPSVLKLGPEPVIEREVLAFHEHVEKYILNNSTSIMGRASSGEWGGIRYTFVGISGPGSRLTWLGEHYRKRPAQEVMALLDRLFSRILKPWYGQPRWEEIRPYQEHNPLHLFPTLLEEGGKVTGIPAEAETLPCPELGLDLPNPFRFLKHGYPARKDQVFLWYRCVAHGDLNMQNILLDEKENLYVIDFSETRVRNAVSDFARLEAIAKIETTRLQGERDLRLLLGFEAGLASASRLGEAAPNLYEGDDPEVEKAFRVISLLRGYADRVTLFEENIIPYYLALLEWTYPVASYRNATVLQKRFAAFSAGLIVRKILELEREG